MAGNSIGKILVLTTFGESHGPAIGGILDGFPSRIAIDPAFIQSELDRRRPGQSPSSSSRKEKDRLAILSGIFEGISTGAPIAFVIQNEDARSEDYDALKDVFRPSHADFTYQEKYGFRDHRGGGRASARETAARVAGGAFAKILLRQHGISVHAWVSAIGAVSLPESFILTDPGAIRESLVGCPDPRVSAEMEKLIGTVKAEGDTLGGVISCVIRGVPAGLGEPVFDKLQADLGKAILSINAVKGFEYGSGFSSASMKGSENNDLFILKEGKIATQTNRSGGIQGGISNGQEICFRAAFKPVATLMKDQQGMNLQGEPVIIKPKGRHDVCVVPRAIPIVEAMAALVTGDHLLRTAANFSGKK